MLVDILGVQAGQCQGYAGDEDAGEEELMERDEELGGLTAGEFWAQLCPRGT